MATQSKQKNILLKEIKTELDDLNGDFEFVFFLLLWSGVIGANEKMLFKNNDEFQAHQKSIQGRIKEKKEKINWRKLKKEFITPQKHLKIIETPFSSTLMPQNPPNRPPNISLIHAINYLREYFIDPHLLKKIVDLRISLLSGLNPLSTRYRSIKNEIDSNRNRLNELPQYPNNALIDKILKLYGVWHGNTLSKSEFSKRKKHLQDKVEETYFDDWPDELKKVLKLPMSGKGSLPSYSPSLEDLLLYFEMNREKNKKKMHDHF